MALPLFQSDSKEALKKLFRNAFSSSEERDQLLEAVSAGAKNFKAADVIWMVFRPDRAIREAGIVALRPHNNLKTVDLFLEHCKGKPEAAMRAATTALFGLRITGIEQRLVELAESPDEEVRTAVRSLVLGAPPSQALEPLLWQLALMGSESSRKAFLDRLSRYDMSQSALTRWKGLARAEEHDIREFALTILAQKAPEASIDLIVAELPRSGYATQQYLVAAITAVSAGKGPEFADRILPLMASGNPGTRSAVLKILLGMENRPELVRRYLDFSKTLAGWARDRALESMNEFGDALVEPAIELLGDPDLDVRASALVVAGSFEDPRVVPAVISLLKDEDWWMRITAAETLGRLGDPRAVPALIESLKDNEARWSAVEALGRIGDPQALPALAQVLKDPQAEVRIEVLLALKHFNHPKIFDVLRRVAETDTDRIVRARALEITEDVARRTNTEITDGDKLRSGALHAQVGADEPGLHTLLIATRNQMGSDFHLSVGQPPMIRLASDLVRAKGDSFSGAQTENLLREILTEDQWSVLERDQQLDFCYYIPKAGRYRGNVFLDQRGFNAVFRVIPEQPPTITEVGLPPHLAEIADYHQGLVLVCGPSGSGKSTTLAALVNLFNETRHDHIITLEDPVEFVHPFKNCLINQREVGRDTGSFARALRAALREDPDVIVIGDLRDNQSVSLALTAAETGHIVLGTLNSTTAAKAVDRLIASFPSEEQSQVRTSLAESLKYVIAQRLIPAKGESRQVASFEILKGTLSVASMIRDEKTFQIPSAMQVGRSLGMQTHDDALRDLLRAEKITAETAYLIASSKKEFEALVSAEFLESRTFL